MSGRDGPGQRSGPGGDQGRENQAAAKQLGSVSNSTPTVPAQPAGHGDHREQVRGCLVLVVETPNGKYRRRTFLTLAAAERACRNAREAGQPASVTVAQLVPVAVVA